MAINLEEAALLSYDRASVYWIANTLDVQFRAFVDAAELIFSDNAPADRVVGDWLIPMRALGAALPTFPPPMPQEYFIQVVEYLYRICLACQTNFPSVAQFNALLAAWNLYIGP